MEPRITDERLPSKIDELENFYLECLKNGAYVQTQKG